MRYTTKHMHDAPVTPEPPVAPTALSPRRKLPGAVWFFVAAGLFAVYGLGVAVGQGRVSFSNVPRPARDSSAAVLDYTSVNQVYRALRDNYDGKLDNETILSGLKHGLARSVGDPYTEYFSQKESEDFSNDLQGTITGIGAKLDLDTDSNVVIVAPLEGSPSEAAGVRAKDLIVSIDGTPTAGMSASEAVVKIRGKKGTQVRLEIMRDKKQALEFVITRDTIKVPTATSKLLDGNIGYLQVSQFGDDTDELVLAAARDFAQKGVKGVVLDLRDNPGGEVVTAVNLSSLWLKKGDVVVEQRRGKTRVDTSRAVGNAVLEGVPTVVLVNGGSASASEITALALRDYGAAKIVGEKTYGKGVVQELVPFEDGSALKVTVGKWYSPKGTSVDKTGLQPDQEIKLTDEDYKNQNDKQLQAATDILSRQ